MWVVAQGKDMAAVEEVVAGLVADSMKVSGEGMKFRWYLTSTLHRRTHTPRHLLPPTPLHHRDTSIS